MSKIFQNKIALITGASRGLGRAVAKNLAKNGAELILVSRTISALESLDDEIKSLGSNSTIVPMDLEDNDKIDLLGNEIYKKWGKLDILVSCAGIIGDITPVAHLNPKLWNKVINLNLSVNYRIIRSFEPLLKISENVKINDFRGAMVADNLFFDLKKQTLNIASFNDSKINANINLK